jgi:predicted transcriptional regulator
MQLRAERRGHPPHHCAARRSDVRYSRPRVPPSRPERGGADRVRHLPTPAQHVRRCLVGGSLDQILELPDHRCQQRVDRRAEPGEPHEVVVPLVEMAALVGDQCVVHAGVERVPHPGRHHDPPRAARQRERVDLLAGHHHDLVVTGQVLCVAGGRDQRAPAAACRQARTRRRDTASGTTNTDQMKWSNTARSSRCRARQCRIPAGRLTHRERSRGRSRRRFRRRPGALEAEVLAVLEKAGSAMSPGEIRDALDPGGSLSYSAVVTTLTRLHDKHAVSRKRVGRAYRYIAVDASTLVAWRMGRLLDAQADHASVLTRFVSALDESDAAVLRGLLAAEATDRDAERAKRQRR